MSRTLEATSVVRTCTSFASAFQEFGNNCIQAGDAWKTIGFTENLLECYQKALVGVLDVPWPCDDNHAPDSFAKAVSAAKAVIDQELTDLRDQIQAYGWGGHMMVSAVFPDGKDRHLRVATDVLNRVFNHLNLQRQTGLQNIEVKTKNQERQRLQQRISHDERYVPRDDLEQKISSDLKDAQEKCVIVVLFGGPGTGKSTLAREIGSHYIGPGRDTSEDTSEDTSSRVTRVVILECGPKVESVAAKQTELLQKLGGHVSQRSQGFHDFDVLKGLQTCFKDQHDLLIILDDVEPGQLLSELVSLFPSESESGAKLLLTSQQESVCDYLESIGECKKHKVEDLSKEDAIRVLASSAGFKNKPIPEHLRAVADEIIEKSGANPLALATLGAQIAKARRRNLDSDEEIWENVLDGMYVLSDGEHAREGVYMHGVLYPSSLMAIMQRSIGLLTTAREQLLVLIGMCRVRSVSLYALKFLYDATISECSLKTFIDSCHELESRHLFTKNEIEPTVVSIHPMAKGYVENRMKGTVKSVNKLLNKAIAYSVVKTGETEASNPTRASVTRVLADLFIDSKLRGGALAPHSDPSRSSRVLESNETQDNSTIMELKRTTSEPIMKLLVLKARRRNQWTEELGVCAQTVLLKFVDNKRLDQESISQLLGSRCAAISILDFLKNLCLLEKKSWNFWDSGEGNPKGNYVGCNSGIPGAFLNLLRDDSCTALQERAASVLADLCCSHKKNSNAFASTPGMLPQLRLFLSKVRNFNLQKYAARILAACAYWDYYCDGSVVPKIVAEAGVVDSLVDVLGKEQNEENLSVQIAVAHALSNLATAKPTVKKTVSAQAALDPDLAQDRSVVSGNSRDDLAQWPGLLKGLTELLEKPGSDLVLQAHACATVANIAGTDEVETLKRLIRFSGLVNKLVSTLNEGRNAQLQVEAARAICNLATYREENPTRQKLMDWTGLLEALVKSLLRTDVPSLQLHAARAFSHLAYQIEKNHADRVLSRDLGLVESLMELFSICHNSSDQAARKAADLSMSTLCSLADVGDNSLKARIVSFPPPLEKFASLPPFLVKLTESILAGEVRAFEADAVCLIANLAVTNEDGILDNIASSPGLVEKLAKLLSESQDSFLQGNAIRALLNLAGEENNDNFDVASFPDLLRRLPQAWLQSGRVDRDKNRKIVHEHVVRALADAKGKESAER